MMSCNARPASTPVAERRAESAPSRPDPARARDADAFARLLRHKSRAGDGETVEDDSPSTGCGRDTEGERRRPGPHADPLAQPGEGAAAAPCLRHAPTMEAVPSAILSALEIPAAVVDAANRAALAGEAPASIAATLQPDAAEQRWEVSVGEPLGVQVELRATRAAVPATAGAALPWDLTIASQVLGRAALARHASRLDDRLRARGLAPGHLRIEDAQDDSAS